ncbi:MAG: response regulator [Phycisphaerales bacterium]
MEDDDHHSDLISRTLKRAMPDPETEILHISDGEAAVQFLSCERETIPKLIVLDLKLPKLNGHEVLKMIKSSERLRVVPVVILTTSLSDTDRHEALALQANSVLTKSVNFKEFQTMLTDMVKYWLRWNRGY